VELTLGVVKVSFILRRKSGNKTLHYLVKSVKVNGVSRHQPIMCLGTAEDIAAKFQEQNACKKISSPDFGKVYQFGAVAALLDISKRLNIDNLIDEHIGKREQGLSIGSYIVLAAINRAVCPVSKNSFYEWFRKTVLVSTFPKGTENTLSSQAFWNHMVLLDRDKISDIEDDLTQLIVKDYNISTKSLLFDNTNFITYIDTSNPATIPQRGHSKEKRSDLKIIGLSLMVSPEYNIPLFHETYPGNRSDAKQFAEIINKLKKRYSIINDNDDDITLVFDKGNNSESNIDLLDDDYLAKFHFVGGLKFNQCPELLDIAPSLYTPLTGESFQGCTAYRVQKEVFGRLFTVVITDNPPLKNAQLVGIMNNIDKCQIKLKELQDRLQMRENGLIKGGKAPTFDSITKNIKKILSGDHMNKIFTCNLTEKGKVFNLQFQASDDGLEMVKQKYLGKTILFTDRHGWSNEKIVSAYRSQFHVEQSFKQMKNTKYLSFRPVRHFTDRTIIVHSFYCIISYTLCCLLQLEMEKLDFKMSINKILDELSESSQSIHFIIESSGEQIQIGSTFTIASEGAEKYIAKYNLKKYSI
jgi:transposase